MQYRRKMVAGEYRALKYNYTETSDLDNGEIHGKMHLIRLITERLCAFTGYPRDGRVSDASTGHPRNIIKYADWRWMQTTGPLLKYVWYRLFTFLSRSSFNDRLTQAIP